VSDRAEQLLHRVHDSPLEAEGNEADIYLTSLGLALVLAGQPIAWWMRGALFDSESAIFPATVVLLGLGLILRLRPFAGPVLQIQPWLIGLYGLGYLLPIAFMSLVDTQELGDASAYAIFTAMVLAALAIVPLRSLSMLAPATAIVGGLSSLLPMVELATSPIIESFTRLTLKGNNNPLVLGMIGGATIHAVLVALHTSRQTSFLLGLIYGFIAAVAVAAVILSNTRSVILSLILTIPLFYFILLPRIQRSSARRNRGKMQVIAFSSVLTAAAIAAPAGAALLLGPELVLQVGNAAAERATGALAAATGGGGGGTVDRSSQERIDVFERTMNGLTPQGRGISAQVRTQGDVTGVGIYPHLTYLQAFYDFGIAGAIWFALLHLVLPLLLIAKRLAAGPLDPTTAFIILYYFYSHMDHLTHATPYSWLAVMPVGLVYVLVPRNPLRRLR
jgi:O-antigen ligase